MLYSVVDQENAMKMMEQWLKDSPNSLYKFRPYKVQSDKEEAEATPGSKVDTSNTLLWVHQEPWQQHLMVKYGNIISLMDATYKGTCYDLPLFFICVRTNTGYCVVAEFIVQSKSAECIQEAISVLQQWNPDWSPEFFMSDFCEAEIQALESSFPDSFVYLCDFHREHGWERWVRDKHHNLTGYEEEILLDHLHACAWASSNDSDPELDQDHEYQKCVEVLKRTNIWKQNKQVHDWIEGTSKVSVPKLYEMHTYTQLNNSYSATKYIATQH